MVQNLLKNGNYADKQNNAQVTWRVTIGGLSLATLPTVNQWNQLLKSRHMSKGFRSTVCRVRLCSQFLNDVVLLCELCIRPQS